jgi:uncharacterized protein (TIGR02147 family)
MDISHALLVMLLQGKRKLTAKHVPVIAKGMGLSTAERMYLLTLIQLGGASAPERSAVLENWLHSVNPGDEFLVREIDEFKILSEWIHFAILAFLETKKPVRDMEDVVKRFSHRIAPNEIRSAFSRLFSQGLITRDLTGRFHTKYSRVTSKDDVANRGAREYFKQTSNLAASAVEEQDVLEREFQSFSIAMDPRKIPIAKEMIRKFRTELGIALKSDRADEVYQMNLQFFRLTERSPEMVRAEDEGVDPELKTQGKIHV